MEDERSPAERAAQAERLAGQIMDDRARTKLLEIAAELRAQARASLSDQEPDGSA
jgi:hypothetical protein